MFLDDKLKTQFLGYMEYLENDVIITVSTDETEKSQNMNKFIKEISSLSDRIEVKYDKLALTPSFNLSSEKKALHVNFAAIPLGHEFSSFVLALIQVGGRQPKIDDTVRTRIQSIKEKLNFEIYISLTCHICPDVVQALNIMAVVNPNISSTMIDGGIFKDLVEERQIMAVPTVFLNGEEFAGGRITIEEILNKILGEDDQELDGLENLYDVLIIGGGPAGVSSTIYAARKGLKTMVITDRVGGQVLETVSINNLIGTPHTEGAQLAQSLEEHLKDYDIKALKRNVVDIKTGDTHEVILESGHSLKTKTLIIATGARWRQVGVPGEEEFKNKGVAYCPHCDGPMFENKDVVVIGGGNSGIEAAIDLSNITNKVTVLEFLDELKADQVLQEKVAQIDNITVITSAQTKEIKGNDTVSSIDYIDRSTGEQHSINTDGVFVQIGLVPNTEWMKDLVEMTPRGEIVVDAKGATSVPGIYAAGDCTDSLYKQIIISMGSGATAALGAFDYIIKN